VVACIATGVAGCGDAKISTRTVTVERSPSSSGASQTPGDSQTTATPTTTTPGPSSDEPGTFVRCDANISAKQGATTCGFATNAFYTYWKHQDERAIQVFSPASNRMFTTRCTGAAGTVECTTSDGGAVRFSRAAVDRYSEAQADRYAATHDLTPTPVSVGGGTVAPTDTTTTDTTTAPTG
jgi:hypothetical protein